ETARLQSSRRKSMSSPFSAGSGWDESASAATCSRTRTPKIRSSSPTRPKSSPKETTSATAVSSNSIDRLLSNNPLAMRSSPPCARRSAGRKEDDADEDDVHVPLRVRRGWGASAGRLTARCVRGELAARPRAQHFDRREVMEKAFCWRPALWFTY